MDIKTYMKRIYKIRVFCINECNYNPTDRQCEIIDVNYQTVGEIANIISVWEKEEKKDKGLKNRH